MEIFATSGLINGIVSSAFGILIIGKNWRERANQIYFLMTISLAVWSFSYWQWLLSSEYDMAFFWIRLLSFGSLFIPVLFFHWVTLLLDKRSINSIILYISYISIIIVSFFINTEFFIESVRQISFFTFWPIAGFAYDFYFSFIYLGLISYTIYILIRSYNSEKISDKKGQILYILIGSLLGFGGGLTNFPLWFGIPFPPYGNFLVTAFPFFLGYSTFKYKLFNAKTIATEILVFFISIILLVEVVLSKSILETILRGGLFIVISIFGYLLIKSVIKEISQREHIQELATDLQKANDRLMELDKQKSEFVSFATHQLRSPLTAMKGYASLILDGDLGKLSHEIRNAIMRIYDSSNTLTNIVDDYLNISQIELGTMKYYFENVDLKELVADVINELKPNIEKSKIKFSFEVDIDKKYMVNADKDKFKQIIANLVDNSIKYTPFGSTMVSLYKKDGKIIFSAKDTGIGIAEEVMPRLFSKFSRANNADKQDIHGTGLGLFVAKEIVLAHKGRIWAESAGEGKGSTFFVELEEVI